MSNCKILALSDNPSVDFDYTNNREQELKEFLLFYTKNEFLMFINKLISKLEEPKKINKCKIISIFFKQKAGGKTTCLKPCS